MEFYWSYAMVVFLPLYAYENSTMWKLVIKNSIAKLHIEIIVTAYGILNIQLRPMQAAPSCRETVL